MKITRSRMVVLVFVAFAAVLMLLPQRENPAMLATVVCAATAVALLEHLRAGADAAAVAAFEPRWRRLDRAVQSLRRTGRAEPAQMKGFVEDERRARDDRFAAGEGAAWEEKTYRRIDQCEEDMGVAT